MIQRLTVGVPNFKSMSDFEEKVLATFGSATVDGVKRIRSFGLMSQKSLPIEYPTSPTETTSSSKLQSPTLMQPSNATVESRTIGIPEPSANPALFPCSSLNLENQVTPTSLLSITR